MSLSISIGNLLFKRAFWLYKPLYYRFKTVQDRHEIALLKAMLKPGDTVLDIGANIGFYARLLSEIVGPRGQVHCFEPDPINFAHLQENCRQLKNVHILNKAVGPKTETIRIYTSKKLNVDHRTYEPEEYDQVLDIEAINIDAYVKEKQIRVNLIKMDIQGFEMQAIQGMTELLRNTPQISLLSEFWPYGLRKAGSSASAYFSYLEEQGFRVYLLEQDQMLPLQTEKVKQLEALDESHYFNILARREHV